MKPPNRMDMKLRFLLHEAMEHEEGKEEIGAKVLGVRQIHLPITNTNGTHLMVREVLREDTRQSDTDRDRLDVASFRYDYLSREEGGNAVRVLSRHGESVGLSLF